MTLGERLRKAIDGKNKSHAWVAQEVGITPASLSAILTGKTEDPSFFTVLAIARTLGEPLSAIVDDPLHYWKAEELGKLEELGGWLVERTVRKGAGQPLAIPPRRKQGGGRTRVLPVAATPDFVLYPDAFEQPRKRIPAKYRRNADAVFSVTGESMIGENIQPRDLLYVRRTSSMEDAVGRIVVCTVDDMILVKRLMKRDGALVLESANPTAPVMRINEDAVRFALIGIVIANERP